MNISSSKENGGFVSSISDNDGGPDNTPNTKRHCEKCKGLMKKIPWSGCKVYVCVNTRCRAYRNPVCLGHKRRVSRSNYPIDLD